MHLNLGIKEFFSNFVILFWFCCYLSFSFSSSSAWEWTQGLIHVRQMFYHWTVFQTAFTKIDILCVRLSHKQSWFTLGNMPNLEIWKLRQRQRVEGKKLYTVVQCLDSRHSIAHFPSGTCIFCYVMYSTFVWNDFFFYLPARFFFSTQKYKLYIRKKIHFMPSNGLVIKHR